MGSTILETLNEIQAAIADQPTQSDLQALTAELQVLANRIAPEGRSIFQPLDDNLPYLAYLAELEKLDDLAAIARSIRQSGGSDGEPAEYYPDEWPDAETYLSYKCLAANAIYDQVEDLCIQMSVEDWDALLQQGLSVAAGSLVALVSALIVGTLTGAIIPAVGAFIIAIAFGDVVFDASDILLNLQTNKGDVIRGMYNATDVQVARDQFLDLSSLSPVEAWLLRYFLTDELLETLFTYTELYYEPENPVSCDLDELFRWQNGQLITGTAFRVVEDEIDVPVEPIDNTDHKTIRFETSGQSGAIRILIRGIAFNESPGGGTGDCHGGQGFWGVGSGEFEINIDRYWNNDCGYYHVGFDPRSGSFQVTEAYIWSI